MSKRIMVHESDIAKLVSGSFEHVSSMIEDFVHENYEAFGASTEEGVALLATFEDRFIVANDSGEFFSVSYELDGDTVVAEDTEAIEIALVEGDGGCVDAVGLAESLGEMSVAEAVASASDVDVFGAAVALAESDAFEFGGGCECRFDSERECVLDVARRLAVESVVRGDDSVMMGASVMLMVAAKSDDGGMEPGLSDVHSKWCCVNLGN